MKGGENKERMRSRGRICVGACAHTPVQNSPRRIAFEMARYRIQGKQGIVSSVRKGPPWSFFQRNIPCIEILPDNTGVFAPCTPCKIIYFAPCAL